jgi:hypothetical protein
MKKYSIILPVLFVLAISINGCRSSRLIVYSDYQDSLKADRKDIKQALEYVVTKNGKINGQVVETKTGFILYGRNRRLRLGTKLLNPIKIDSTAKRIIQQERVMKQLATYVTLTDSLKHTLRQLDSLIMNIKTSNVDTIKSKK